MLFALSLEILNVFIELITCKSIRNILPQYIQSLYIYIYIYIHRPIGEVSVFANDPGDQGSVPGRVKLKTQKIVLDGFLFNIQHYKVWIKGKRGNPGKELLLLLDFGVLAIENEAFSSHLSTVGQLIIYIYIYGVPVT